MKKPFGKIVALLLVLGLSIALASVSYAYEVQLAGIRLGDSATRLLAVYGTPDGLLIAGSGGSSTSALMMMPGMSGGMMMPGMPGGMMPSMPTMGPMPGMTGGMPMPGLPGMTGGGGLPMMGPMPGIMPQAPPMPPGAPGSMAGNMGGGAPGGPTLPMMPGPSSAGAGPGMSGGMPMPGAMPGMMPGMPGMGGGGASSGGGSVNSIMQTIQDIASFRQSMESAIVDSVAVPLNSGEVEWLYLRPNGVVLGFVINQEGLVAVIVVTGPRCDYARSALGKSGKTIKLNDGFKTVIYRYGVPDAYENIDGRPTTDMVLRYTNKNNIAFTLMDMKVTRIHIWQPD